MAGDVATNDIKSFTKYRSPQMRAYCLRSEMFNAIPWAAAIRMEDMKLTHEQPKDATTWMDFIAIAKANNQ